VISFRVSAAPVVVAVLATLAAIPHRTAASAQEPFSCSRCLPVWLYAEMRTAQALLSDKLDAWLTAVDRHVPGRRDQAIDQVARWPVRDFDDALRELGRRLQRSEFQPLAKFGVHDLDSGNALLIRAAMLHADVAIVHRGERGYSLPQAGVRSMLVGDGNEVGQMGGTIHWGVGRRALELVQPAPARDDRVKHWYQATAAYLQQWNEYSELGVHLLRARALFPNDAVLLLYAGTMHEAFAEGRIQNALPQNLVRILTRPNPATPQSVTPVGPAEEELDRAEDYFRRALARDPSLTEARIRLGHVLHRRARQPNAIAELERALRDKPRMVLRFYAHLLIGRAQVARGRPDLARTAFEEAAGLYPNAQSPRLGLSQLARDAGDRAGSVRELMILTQPPDAPERQDPWWIFNWTHAPDADELFALLRQTLIR
jgi:tetratricopeptide (TPR) repeat protein